MTLKTRIASPAVQKKLVEAVAATSGRAVETGDDTLHLPGNSQSVEDATVGAPFTIRGNKGLPQ